MKGSSNLKCLCNFDKTVEIFTNCSSYETAITADPHKKQIEDFAYTCVIILLFMFITVLCMVKNNMSGMTTESELALERFRQLKFNSIWDETPKRLAVKQQLIRLGMLGKTVAETNGDEISRKNPKIRYGQKVWETVDDEWL